MLLIILGAVIDFIALAGFIGAIAGDAQAVSALPGFIVFLVIGAGLIFWGASLKKKKRLREDALIGTIPYNAWTGAPAGPQTAAESGGSEAAGDAGGGVIVIRWKKHWMIRDSFTSIYVDGRLVDLLSFLRDSETLVPAGAGVHRVQASLLGFRKAETIINVKQGGCELVNLNYSRATGGLKFDAAPVSVPADDVTMQRAKAFSEGRTKLIAAMAPYISSGFGSLKFLSDTKAIFYKYSKAVYWLCIFLLWGIITIWLMGPILGATAKKIRFDLQPGGTVAVY